MSIEEKIKKQIKIYPNFPKQGIDFKDIFPLFETPALVDDVIQLFSKHCKASINKKIDVVVGLESRGFLFAPMLAKSLNCSFVPARKKGKLPGDKYSQTYALEYGEDCIEMQKNAIQQNQNVVIVDDLIATGGTMAATCKLINQFSANIVCCLSIVELTGLEGKKKLPSGTDVYSIVQYEF